MTDAATPEQPRTALHEQSIYVHDCLLIEVTLADLQSLFEAMAKAGVGELDHIRISRHTDGLRIDSKPQAIEAQARPAVASVGLRADMMQAGLWHEDDSVWFPMLDAALAAERKATVERIRAALGVPLWHIGPRHTYFDMEKVLAILDAEAAR